MFDIPFVFDDNSYHTKLWSDSWSIWMQPRGPLVVFGPQPWDVAYPFHEPEGSANGQGGERK